MDDILRRAADNVYDQLGPLQRESTYRDAMALELKSGHGLIVSTEVHGTVWFLPSGMSHPTAVGTHIADILIAEPRIVLELKARTSTSTACIQAKAYKETFGAKDAYVVVFADAVRIAKV